MEGDALTIALNQIFSLSTHALTWRAWVEISLLHISEHRCRVALHVEGVGRNDGDPMSDEAKECRPP